MGGAGPSIMPALLFSALIACANGRLSATNTPGRLYNFGGLPKNSISVGLFRTYGGSK